MPVIGPHPNLQVAHLDRLFVAGQLSVNQILALTRQTRPQRIISVVGPPGVGKSWLLTQVFWAMHNATRRRFLPIYLGLSPVDAVALEGELAEWLERILTALRIAVPPMPFKTRFQHFAQEICLKCGNCVPVLLVDGFEELDDESREFVFVQVIKQFLSEPTKGRPLCTRVILTRRDKMRLSRDGRYVEDVHTLQGWLPESEAPDKQVDLLLDFLADGTNSPEMISSQLYRDELTAFQITNVIDRARGYHESVRQALTPFLSGNPLINSLLVANVLLDPLGQVTADQLYDCQRRYMEQTLVGHTVAARDAALEQLRGLIQLLQDATLDLPPTALSAWTPTDLENRRVAKLKRDGASRLLGRLKFDELKLLSRCSIIARSETLRNTHAIDPALVKLVNDTALLDAAHARITTQP